MALTPLATQAQFNATQYKDLARDYVSGDIDTLMLRATRALESFCARRLAPFTGLQEEHRALGIPNEGRTFGSMGSDQIGAIASAGYGAALGVGSFPRQVLLDQWPPLYPDLWTGTLAAISIVYPWGGTATIPVASVDYQITRGYVRFSAGTYVEHGATVRVTYSGGYSSVPDDLVEACCTQAALLAISRAVPQAHGNVDKVEVKEELDALAGPYMRS